MKKIIALVLCLAMLSTLCGCNVVRKFVGRVLPTGQSQGTMAPITGEDAVGNSAVIEGATSQPTDEIIDTSSTQRVESVPTNILIYPEFFTEHGTLCTVKANGGLNLRYGPGKEYASQLIIPDGTSLAELAFENGWIFVQYKGKYGWVSQDYIVY